jgi:glycosyltransferase involved in cell wall biosynthesis
MQVTSKTMNALSGLKNDNGRNADLLLVSVIINNYNYAAYLGDAIDSALRQDYSQKEVLVVDDGSTDRSRDVIAGYGSRITPIFKTNGGQASALNAGFTASHGDIILFLDADDVLLPSALTNAVRALNEPNVSSVRWPMWIVDADGNKTGGTKPPKPPAEGDFRGQLFAHGPSNLPCSPTSGNAWSRSFLERVLPMPEDAFRLCADDYLYTLAPAFGQARTIHQPQGCYRIHGQNNYSARSFRDKLQIELSNYDQLCNALSTTLKRNGMPIDLNAWKQHSWFHRLDRAVSNILNTVPDESSLVLVEGGTWDADGAFGRRTVRPFVEHKGEDWGPPPDSDAAIAQLESIRRSGSNYLVIAWPSFWWFDEYPTFFEHLEEAATCVLRNDDVVIFKLAPVIELATQRYNQAS